MSNVVNNHKYNHKNQPNNISRVHQSINQRGPAPGGENHRISYSNAASRGIHNPPHQSHESVIPKPHPNANSVQQVVITQQTNMASQVSNVNPGASQMSNTAVPNPGVNQMQVMPQTVLQQSGQRFAQPFQQHHQPRPQQQRTLLPTQRNQNPVHTNAVPQAVHQSVHQNMSQQPQHFYMQAPTPIQFQNAIFNPQHMSHAYQTRQMQTGVPPYFPIYAQQQFSAQPSYNSYGMSAVYPTHYTQQTAQMMTNQMHQQRGGPQVQSQTVIQPTQPPQMVQMTAPPNNEVTEPAPIQPKAQPKRPRQMALLQDPSGKEIDIEQLAKEELKVKPVVNRTIESFSGASNQTDVVSTSTPKSGSNDVNSIGLEFATKVAVAATEPITRFTASPNASESDVTVNSRPEAEESVAISSKTPLSELSETNDKNSDNICDDSTDNSVINKISTNSAPNSSGIQIDKSWAQNPNKTIKSQINREINSSEEINENGDITDSCNESVGEKEETIQIELSTQRINNNINNNNNRNKEMILKGDNNRKSEEVIDSKLDINSDQTDNSVTIIDKIEPQLSSDRSSPINTTTVSIESVEKSVKKDIILSNLSENHSEETDDNENNRINEIKNKEVCVEPNDSELDNPSAKTTFPDLPYKEDQWTPLNPEGKKAYDRKFLLAIRDKSKNILKMPEILQTPKNKEIIRKESGSYGYGGGTDDPTGLFLPVFANRQNDFRGPRLRPAQVNQRQSQPGRHPDKTRKVISTSLTQDVKLHTTDNAWKPAVVTGTIPGVDDPEEKETQELLKKIRGILNKLTPQKYEDLLKQIIGLKIDTEDRLKRVLDLVFEKAVDEPAFCIQYANLCKHLSNVFKVTKVNEENTAEEVKFHKLLITKCQKEFETEIYASITDLKERQEEIENTADPLKKKLLTEVLDEDMRRARKRSLGNIKLIGELYKLNMLKANIMVQCIDGLIREADDESLECLCALLKTIGEQIESEALNNAKQYAVFNNFFAKMESIAEQKNPEVKGTSARVRFMLRDVIDMRSNSWKARRDENLPKRIDEIHLEVQKEDEQSARELHQHTLNRKQEERERKQKGGRMGNEEGSQWTTVSGRKSQTQVSQPNVDWSIIRAQQQQNHETLQLGPQSGSGTWSMGARGGAQTSQSRYQTEEKPVNRFSALDGTDARKSSQKSNIPSRDSSKGRSNQQHSGYQSSRNKDRNRDREDAINLTQKFTSSQRQSPSESSPIYPNMMSRGSSRGNSREASAPNSRNSSMRRETPEIEYQLKGTNKSEDEIVIKSKESIKEFIELKNFNEPVLDVTALCNESNVHFYVLTAINYSMDTSSQSNHFTIGRLIDHLISKNIIRIDHLFKGLNLILELADETVIDVPKMWDYIGDVLAPIFINLTQNRKQFLLDLTKLCSEDKKSLLVAKIFKSISQMTSAEKANELWFNSDLNWKDFLVSEQNIEDFVRKNVEFTIGSIDRFERIGSNPTSNYTQFKKEVEFLVKDKKSNDEIQNHISKHMNASETSDHKFTSALFTGVINGCLYEPIDASPDNYALTFEKSVLQTYCPLLTKFLGGDPEREFQALIALQELMDALQHPSGLLYKLFQSLHDNGVISQDAFLQWEKSENSRPGKAVAVKSVTSFLTWLRENEDDEEDNEPNS